MTDSVVLLDVGGTFVKGGIADSAGNLAEGQVWQVPVRSEGSKEEIFESLAESLRQGIAKSQDLGMRAAGLAATFPGPFDYNAGVPLMEHKFAAIYGMDLKEWIRGIAGERFGVSFVHDVNAQLSGEMFRGAATGFRNVCVITLGTGLGFAFSIDGRIQYSSTASPARSIYNMPYRDGILEDYVSKRGFLKAYRELTGKDEPDLTVKEIGRRAAAGDSAALKTFSEAASILASAVGPTLSEIGTECLLFGGQISRSFIFMEKTLREGLAGVRSLERVSTVAHIEEAALYGAFATFARQHPDLDGHFDRLSHRR